MYMTVRRKHSNKIALENAWKEVATAMGKTVVKVKMDCVDYYVKLAHCIRLSTDDGRCV